MENKPAERIQATHFIEQFCYKDISNELSDRGVKNLTPTPIEKLSEAIADTKRSFIFKTTAVFKIKYKTQ